MMRLEGKTAIVTGAASGFGKGIAHRFIKEGAQVVFADINADGVVAEAAVAGDNARSIKCDVTMRDDVEACVEHAISAFGKLDIVVNNAGWSHSNKSMLDVSDEEFDKIFSVNVKSIYLMTQACLPHQRKNGSGVIINVGSTAALRPRPGLTWYNASKGAVSTMTKSMAVELAPDNIRVNCLAPVMGVTGLLETFMGMPDTPKNREKFLSTIPLGRLCEPEDMAKAALFLASDDAEFITGTVMEVDGGRCI